MKVNEYTKKALKNCSVPIDILPHSLKASGYNFFNYCYNAHDPSQRRVLSVELIEEKSDLWDPSGEGVVCPMLPGDLGLFTNTDVSDDDVQQARDKIGTNSFPIWAPDLFAVTSTLLEQSGAYQRMRPVDIRYHENGEHASKQDWLNSCFEEFDWQGHASIHPASNDIFGVCGVNRYILRLIGLMWAHGAFTVLLPGELTTASSDEEVLKALSKSIEAQATRANHAFERFAKFFSKEIDEDLLAEFEASLNDKIRETYRKKPLNRSSNVTKADLVNVIPEDEANQNYSRYLARVALNGCVKQQLRNHDTKDANAYNQAVEAAMKADRAPGLLRIIWALDYIQHQWKKIIDADDNLAPFNPKRLPIVGAAPETLKSWEWSKAAIRLLIISDEASRAIGFSDRATGKAMSLGPEDTGPYDPKIVVPGSSCKLVWETFKSGYDSALRETNKWKDEDDKLLPLLPRTLTRCFDDELGSVLPKARTSQVGCTVRSLSHNLALLPPRGRVRARWARSPSGEIRETLNVLLIPLPYKLHTRDFRISVGTKNNDAPWGSFKVYPGWLYDYDDNVEPCVEIPITEASRAGLGDDPYWKKPKRRNKTTGVMEQIFASPEAYSDYIDQCHEALFKHVESLTSNLPGEDINAIVLPEAALTYDAFRYLSKRLLKTLPSLEILVSGLCSAPQNLIALDSHGERITGNFVATYLQNPEPVKKQLEKISEFESQGAEQKYIDECEDELDRVAWPMRHIRGKHHRWRLDTRQLADYALSHRLRPNCDWWEDFDFLPREMLFSEFLSGSVLTALICEDLARIEPCQVALRAVGPNLVFVLLMDSAQVKGRWPHQYAGVLADDPGSSVLTLTSFGLIDRSSKSRGYSSRSIGMWREPNGETQEIELPKGYHAQLLTLRSEFTEERTLDSRSDNGDCAIVWRFAGLTPIKAQTPEFRPDEALAAKEARIDALLAQLQSSLDTESAEGHTQQQNLGDDNASNSPGNANGTNDHANALSIATVPPPKLELPD